MSDRLERVSTSTWLHFALIAIVLLVCYGRTLGSYFLADDLGEVSYVWQILHGRMDLFWSNFTGNYMQIPNMAVYRPWLLVTLVVDCLLWKANPVGYYATNLLHYLGCSFFLYLIMRALTYRWGRLRSSATALFSALLFVASPLHAESVSWVVGRVDIVCLMYYLASLYLVIRFLSSGRKLWLGLSLASFVIAILTKEMAIGLPVVATALAFIWPHGPGAEPVESAELDDQSARSNGDGESFSGLPSHSFPASNPTGTSTMGSSADGGRVNSKFEVQPRVGIPTPEGRTVCLEPSPTCLADGTGGEISAHGTALAPAAGAAETKVVQQRESLMPRVESGFLADRVRAVLSIALPFLALTLVYFAVRFICLGTFLGGYHGSIGASQFGSLLSKWSDFDTLRRLIFPLNAFAFPDAISASRLSGALASIYLVILSMVLARTVLLRLPVRLLGFLLLWSLTCLLPIYQLWGLGYNLEGSRFVFFLTASLSAILPVLLLSPGRRLPSSFAVPGRLVDFAGVLMLAALVLVFGKVSLKNNLPWVHAGKEVRAVQTSSASLAAHLDQGKKAALVGIPKDQGGAHMILNGATFNFLTSPPFIDERISDRFVTFDALLFGDSTRINLHHFKQAVASGNIDGFYRWDSGARQFVSFEPGSGVVEKPGPLRLPLVSRMAAQDSSEGPVVTVPFTEGRGHLEKNSGKNEAIEIVAADKGSGLLIDGLSVMPIDFDYLEIQVDENMASSLDDASIRVCWNAEAGQSELMTVAIPANRTDRSRLLLPLSRYWQWFAFGKIESIQVDLPPLSRGAIRALQLIPEGVASPLLSVPALALSNVGDYKLGADGDARIVVDGSAVAGASSVIVEVLKPNFFVDDLEGRDIAGALAGTLKARGSRAEVKIPSKLLQGQGFVQVRARCIDTEGKPRGAYSDPISLRI